jgi:uncharacterized protein (DUF2062 family)
MKSDWRDFRPAIWVAMLGVALVLVVNPPYVGAIFLGAAIGLAIRIRQRRSAPPPASRRRRKRR